MDLEQAIKESWGEDTTFTPEEWTEDNPSRGQCVVSSMVLQDYIGGELLESIVKFPDKTYPTTHVRLKKDDRIIDLTWDQFPEGCWLIEEISEDRDYYEYNSWLNERYLALKERVEQKLEQ